MNMTNSKIRRVCQICGNERVADLHPGILVRPPVAEMIQRQIGSWSEQSWICTEDLQKFRHEYVRALLEADKGEITALDQEVLESLRQQDILSRNPEEELQSSLTVGQRLADRVANVGGSWKFITWFTVVFVVWILSNSFFLVTRPFDPYPFIFLNLVLSCLAAIQAPVIMMSQNRQAAKDRVQADQDFRVNVKAEFAIQQLHRKIDDLRSSLAQHRRVEAFERRGAEG